VWGAIVGKEIICLDTSFANYVASKLLEEGCIEGFRGFRIERREVPLENHRIDLLLRRDFKRLFLEVKSCTLFYGDLAMFPDAVTVRGKEHVELMKKVKGAILFVVHSSSPLFFLPDFHTDFDFSLALYHAREEVEIKAVAVRWEENGTFSFVRELAIPWSLYEREGQNKGAYLLVGYLPCSRLVEVGKQGVYPLERGYYVYVGSGMGSLSGRVKRYFRASKKIHWHIDFLSPFLKDIRVIFIRGSESLECDLARELGEFSHSVPGFGSSDCSCGSHLFFFSSNPLHNVPFVSLLLRFRMGRLAEVLKEEIYGIGGH
jgi:sugar fermentation stimulation protein A